MQEEKILVKSRIINFLKENNNYNSGEDIANDLHLSRQALWKHIQELRNLGYDITAVPHVGYRLLKIPDKLYPWELKYKLNTKFIGKHLFYYNKVSSTMDIALNLGNNSVPEGSVVYAESQTKGRGRLGRDWISPKSKGLYFSVILRPKLSLKKIPCITLVSAVAVVLAISRETSIPLSIKWPNDILVGNKKLVGILTELSAEQDRVNFVVVGIGINVNSAKDNIPAEAASLYSVSGKKFSRLNIFKSVLQEFERIYFDFKQNGSGGVIDKWRRLSGIRGNRVKVISSGKEIKGEIGRASCRERV